MSTSRQCPTCGATVELPPERLADRCAFCETALVDATGSDADAIQHVVPFHLTREQAGRRMRGFLQGQWWAPEAVRQGARPEKLHGVLVPFYVYDGVARSSYTGDVGVWWYRTETHVVNGKVRTRRVRETEWFDVSGTHAATYTRQLVSGSRGLPEGEANALEPFDLGKALPFAPALTAGWIAERASVDHTEAGRIVANEVAERENRQIRDGFLPGDESRNVRNTTELEISEVELALLPVWIATYGHAGKVFRLLVNGQTGETIGKVPRSAWKVGCAVFVALAAVGFVVLAALVVAAVTR